MTALAELLSGPIDRMVSKKISLNDLLFNVKGV